MTEWKYFGQDSGCGTIYRIYRCHNNQVSLSDQEVIELALPNGVWVQDEPAVRNLLNERFAGWFSEMEDEITEEEAVALLAQWDRAGWPNS
jgi:hypothetical protein